MFEDRVYGVSQQLRHKYITSAREDERYDTFNNVYKEMNKAIFHMAYPGLSPMHLRAENRSLKERVTDLEATVDSLKEKMGLEKSLILEELGFVIIKEVERCG